MHTDGISIRYFGPSATSPDNVQYFDFPNSGGEPPWGGDRSPYAPPVDQKQLAFSSFYFRITNVEN